MLNNVKLLFGVAMFFILSNVGQSQVTLKFYDSDYTVIDSAGLSIVYDGSNSEVLKFDGSQLFGLDDELIYTVSNDSIFDANNDVLAYTSNNIVYSMDGNVISVFNSGLIEDVDGYQMGSYTGTINDMLTILTCFLIWNL